MPLQIVRNDITKMQVDAIVNAANNNLLGGGGVDGAIHKAAGRALLAECRKLGGCETGDAKITGAGNLPCKYVIHTVGPVWRGGSFGEYEKLLSCYRKSLALAAEYGCKTVAFPLISSGAYGYPKDIALQTAVAAINSFPLSRDMTVFLVIFDKKAFGISQKLFTDIAEYINDRYAEEHGFPRTITLRGDEVRGAHDKFDEHIYACVPPPPLPAPRPRAKAAPKGIYPSPLLSPPPPLPPPPCAEAATKGIYPSPLPSASKGQSDDYSFTISVPPCPEISEKPVSLDDVLKRLDESFAEMLFRKIDEKGMTDAQCYKRANIDRRLFSKIRSDRLYKPSKPTAVAFAVALELPLDETSELLMKAGFALSHSYKFDIIIEFFIERRNYNIFEINEALFAFDQPLLGA